MYSTERVDLILNYLKLNKRASIPELTKVLFVSEATVRRDLNEMQALGLITRTHGGALYAEESQEISIFVRKTKSAKEKELTASVALKILPDFQTVFIDDSSTCFALAERMNFSHKTVVTNGLRLVSYLAEKNDVRVILLGGELLQNGNAVSGALAFRNLRDLRMDLMLSSCAAISTQGTFEHSTEVMELKNIAFEQCSQRLMLVDSNKFNSKATYRTRPVKDYDLVITNADDDVTEPFKQSGVKIINE